MERKAGRRPTDGIEPPTARAFRTARRPRPSRYESLMFRRARFRDVIARQLDLFLDEHADVVQECDERLAVYNAADRDEAEELYGDYVDAVETGTEILADMRDRFGSTLEETDAEQYESEFNRAVRKQLPRFGLEIENR
jgi:hypothetical protein